MDTLVDQIMQLANVSDEAGRQKILLTLRDLGHSIETPKDTMARIVFHQLQISVMRIACDLKLYNILAESERPLTVAELAEKTGAAPTLMGRLLRYLASQNDIKEVSKDVFAANQVTKILATPGAQGGIYMVYDGHGPAWQVTPDFLKEHNYADIDNADDTPHQKGHNTRLRVFEWAAASRPDSYDHSHQFMKARHMGLPTWLDVYPYQHAAASLSPDQVFFVDIGGGLGHQCVALRERLPDLPNRVILQDTAKTLKHAPPHPGVEHAAQDFFRPQACVGAKIYYMRNIMHDYPDGAAVAILANTRDALAPGSVILVDDIVMPAEGAHWQATSLDLTMMTCNAARERTREEWERLVDGAGLRIRNVYTYTEVLRNSIIECVPK